VTRRATATPASALARAAAGEGAEEASGALGAENQVEGAGDGAAAATALPETSTTAVGKTLEVVTIGCERFWTGAGGATPSKGAAEEISLFAAALDAAATVEAAALLAMAGEATASGGESGIGELGSMDETWREEERGKKKGRG